MQNYEKNNQELISRFANYNTDLKDLENKIKYQIKYQTEIADNTDTQIFNLQNAIQKLENEARQLEIKTSSSEIRFDSTTK